MVCERLRPPHPLAPERHALEGVEPLMQLGGIPVAEKTYFLMVLSYVGFLVKEVGLWATGKVSGFRVLGFIGLG